MSSAFPTKLFGASVPPTETCRMTLVRWVPRPSVEGLLLDTLQTGKPTGLAARWKALGNALGTEGSLRWTIALTEIGRPDNPWSGIRKLWEQEAVGAGQLTMKGLPGFRRAKADPATIDRLTPRYADTMARWRRFNAEERELAQAIRQDAFLGIDGHSPAKPESTYH